MIPEITTLDAGLDLWLHGVDGILHVGWPGGKVTRLTVPGPAREVTVGPEGRVDGK